MRTRTSSRPSHKPNTTCLAVERLEERDVPAISILVDYTLDTRAYGGSGFFQDHPDAKATLNRVAYEMGQRVSANLAAINPSGSNSWSALFFDPRTGGQYSIPNLHIAANTIIVYVGGACDAGQPGRRSAASAATRTPAAPSWGASIAHRGWSGFSLWGGSSPSTRP